MPENISNKILTNMSNRIPKNLLVLKYINIMGGIIRNIYFIFSIIFRIILELWALVFCSNPGLCTFSDLNMGWVIILCSG
jgi:hypothetical protein